MLCCCGGGESGQVVVVVVVVAVKIGSGPARATRLSPGSGLAWSIGMNICSGGGRDSGFYQRISVSPPLFVLSDSSPVSASAGDGESRTIFADVSSCGYAEVPVDASSVVGVCLWNINWSVVLSLGLLQG
ncbi:hypothetical protein Tco_0975296 [Tanacetum coccineum]|uniref:Secreted protein n=1 Tax=Tanacetum coccineum TaxID=301880 RepID=A0ABQ5EE05_9ASTR